MDLACIFSSVILFVLLLVWPENCWLKFSSVVLGILGLLYLFRTLRLLFYMPKFDWHLIHGNFLRKVICFVMMMPFMLFLVPELSGGADSYNMFGNGETHKGISVLWGIFYHFVDPGNQYMVNAESTRVLVAVTSMLGVFLLEGKDFFMGRFKELFSLSHWRYGSVGCDGCLDWKKVYSPGEEFSHLGGDPRKRCINIDSDVFLLANDVTNRNIYYFCGMNGIYR